MSCRTPLEVDPEQRAMEGNAVGLRVYICAMQAIDWLLEEDNPPVRYLTLKHLLRKPEAAPELALAKSRLMQYKVTRGILKHGDRFWGDDDEAYKKYTGKYWQVIFLGQFLADGTDPRIAAGISTILGQHEWTLRLPINDGAQCLTANVLAALARLGYGEHPVVQREREALAQRVVHDGGIDCGGMGYSLLPYCHMAQPKLLLCFTQVSPESRTPAMKSAIKLLAKRLLEREVFVYVPGNQTDWQKVVARNPGRGGLPPGRTVKQWVSNQKDAFLLERGPGDPKPKQGWLKFGFPLHYNSDVLEAMYALAESGTPMSAALEKPLKVIESKRSPEGKWVLENSLNGKMWVDVETLGKPSKWLTYYALRVLSHFGRGAA
ncbi:MAG: hypothetical protein ABSC88_06140 [Terracidiphilus sp.]